MKLLFCKSCNEVFSLSKVYKVCSCGKTQGKYLNNLEAVYSGEGVPLGFANSSFSTALYNQISYGKGNDFTAFCISDNCETFTKID